MKTLFKWILNIILITLIILVVFSGISILQSKKNPGQIPSIMGYSNMSVLSGSMRPLLEPGDMIILKDIQIEDVNIGDIITYRVSSDTFVTHRAIEVVRDNGETKIRTQGDANNTEDQSLITSEDLVGTCVFRIPYGGYVSNFLRSPFGLILGILLPLAILIGSELYTIVSKEKKEKEA